MQAPQRTQANTQNPLPLAQTSWRLWQSSGHRSKAKNHASDHAKGHGGVLHCNAWLEPLKNPMKAVHKLILHPDCCLMPSEAGMISG
jgi:hypothetical protein